MLVEFKEKVDQRKTCIGVIGLGYVGLPLILESVAHGFPTIGFDIDHSKVEMLMAGKSYLKHIPKSSIESMIKTGNFEATSEISDLRRVDCIIICVPTPLKVHREPDLSFIIYSKMDIDTWEVIDAAKTKPFGFMPFYPGPGLGGHCIPIDPFYLTWKAHEYGCHTRFIEIAGEINTSMPMYVIQELMNALNKRGKALNNSRVLVIGLAYKKDVDDIRESPSLKLLDILIEKGANTDYYDPYIPQIGKTREYKMLEKMKSIELTPASIEQYDAVLISTNHSSIDYNELVKHAQLIVDTRNATKDVKHGREKIVKA